MWLCYFLDSTHTKCSSLYTHIWCSWLCAWFFEFEFEWYIDFIYFSLNLGSIWIIHTYVMLLVMLLILSSNLCLNSNNLVYYLQINSNCLIKFRINDIWFRIIVKFASLQAVDTDPFCNESVGKHQLFIILQLGHCIFVINIFGHYIKKMWIK